MHQQEQGEENQTGKSHKKIFILSTNVIPVTLPDLSPALFWPPPEPLKYPSHVIYSKPAAALLRLSPCPLSLSLPSPADWIIEHWTEDSWKDWLPERSGGPMLNTNLQKLWEKATNSSIFTVSSHRRTLWEEEGEGCRARMPAWTYRWSEVVAAPECWSEISNNGGVTVVHCFLKPLKGNCFIFKPGPYGSMFWCVNDSTVLEPVQ